VWTDYLSKVSQEWRDRVGTSISVNWPVGIAGNGNAGVADLVAKTPNSIGYVELTYAVKNGLTYGTVRNQTGNFVDADLASVTAAAAQSAARYRVIFVCRSRTRPGKSLIRSLASRGCLSLRTFPMPRSGRPSKDLSGGDWQRGRVFLSLCLTHVCRTRSQPKKTRPLRVSSSSGDLT